MSTMIYFKGLLLGLAMIIPIGPQNAFVLEQGMRRQHYLWVALLCALSDVLLINLGIFGGSALLGQWPLLLQVITWGGVAFLLWYGWGAIKSALAVSSWQLDTDNNNRTRWKMTLFIFAVTWLNPHVYLDTVVVLGSIGGQMPSEHRLLFSLGAVTASFIWFFGLAILAAKLAPWLQQPKIQRIIYVLVALIMWGIAWQLAQQAMTS